MVVMNREGTEVEDLVMEGTERYAVRRDVGASGLAPADVGSLEPDRSIAESKVQPTYGTTVLVSHQYLGPELRVSRLAEDG